MCYNFKIYSFSQLNRIQIDMNCKHERFIISKRMLNLEF
jgi:hypothetical protein